MRMVAKERIANEGEKGEKRGWDRTAEARYKARGKK
jgi:hypothetical protein